MGTHLRRDASWLGLANLAVKPFWLVFISVLCVRYLSPAEYGVLSTVLNLGLLSGALTDLGTTTLTVREVASHPAEAPRYLTNFLVLRLALTVVATGAFAGFGLLLGYDASMLTALALSCLYVGSLNLRGFARAFLEAHGRLAPESVFLILERGAVMGMGTVGLLVTRRAEGTLGGMALGMALVTTVHFLWLAHRLVPLRRKAWSLAFLRQAVRQSAPLAVITVLGLLYYRSDVVMVEAFLGTTAAGQYGVAYQFINGASILPTIVVSGMVFPRLSRLWAEGARKSYWHLLGRVAGGLLTAGVAVALVLVFAAGPLIGLLTQHAEGYSASVDVLQLLAWTFPFNCLQYLFSTATVAMRVTRPLTGVLGAACVINLTANALLIPRVGLLGAAAVTVASEAFVVVCLGFYLFHARRTTLFAPASSPVLP